MPINTILGDVSLRGIEVLKNRVTQISPRYLSERSSGGATLLTGRAATTDASKRPSRKVILEKA